MGRPSGRLTRRENREGWLFTAPWTIGFLLFTLGPMIVSAVISFTSWDIVTPPVWVGLDNYVRMFTKDELIPKSLLVTTTYAVLSVPLQLALGLFVAILMNQKLRFQSAWRTIYYLPSVVSGVAVALLWRWIFSGDFGVLNWLLSLVGVEGPAWLLDETWALPAFIIMSLWGIGGGMLIYLAGLQGIPTDLYEAAEIDGAGTLQKFYTITIPMISPVLFFNLVIGIISALQVFTAAFIMTQGGPNNATEFFMLYLYQNAFQWFKMGYASAMAWVLFLYILALTLLVFRTAQSWVFYEGSTRGRG